MIKKKGKKRQMDMFISTDKKIDYRTLPINPAQIMFDWVDKLKLTVSRQCMIMESTVKL